MRDGVNTAGCAHSRRQRESQIDVVDHGPRENPRVCVGRLNVVCSLAENGGHFATSIGSRDANMRKSCPEADSLPQADSATAANRDDGVRTLRFRIFKSFIGDMGRSVHGSFRKHSGDLSLEDIFHILGLVNLVRRREHQRSGEIKAGYLVAKLLQRATAEDDTPGIGVVLKIIHGESPAGVFKHLKDGRDGDRMATADVRKDTTVTVFMGFS